MNVDLMLIDFAMPGMSGAEVVRRARTTRPALPILFIIGKPHIGNELHAKVRLALARRGAGKVVALPPS